MQATLLNQYHNSEVDINIVLLKNLKDQKKTNKRYTDIAIKSILVEKIKDGKLLLIDKLINVSNSVVSGLLIHTSSEDNKLFML